MILPSQRFLLSTSALAGNSKLDFTHFSAQKSYAPKAFSEY